jgi:hypothetical protein
MKTDRSAGTLTEPACPMILKVHNPSGAYEVTPLHAPRVSDLNGKTICELSDNMWQDFRIFPLIRELLLKQFPEAKIIPYNEFPHESAGGAFAIDDDKVASMVKARGCQAAIIGIAA